MDVHTKLPPLPLLTPPHMFPVLPPHACAPMPPQHADGDSFGASMALSGSTLAVGCPLCPRTEHTSSASASTGRVFIFQKHLASSSSSSWTGAGWGLAREVQAAATHTGGRFGHCLSLDGPLLLVTSSPTLASRALSSSAASSAHIFQRRGQSASGGGGGEWWGLAAFLSAGSNATRFGEDCAISGRSLAVANPAHTVWDGAAWVARGTVHMWKIASSSSSPATTPAPTAPFSPQQPYPYTPWHTALSGPGSAGPPLNPANAEEAGDRIGASVSSDAVASLASAAGGDGWGEEGGGEVILLGAPFAWPGRREGGAARVLMRSDAPPRSHSTARDSSAAPFSAWEVIQDGFLVPDASAACPAGYASEWPCRIQTRFGSATAVLRTVAPASPSLIPARYVLLVGAPGGRALQNADTGAPAVAAGMVYVYETGGQSLAGNHPSVRKVQTLFSDFCPSLGDGVPGCSGNEFGAALAVASSSSATLFSPLGALSSEAERAHSHARVRRPSEIAVVGVPGASRDAGEAHIYERDSTGVWVPTRLLFAPGLPDKSGSYPPVGCSAGGVSQAWCSNSEAGTLTTRNGDRFGASLAVLLHTNEHMDTVFVGAPRAGHGKGAVYVFRRGQASYEALGGLRHVFLHARSKTLGGTAEGGGWGLEEILFDAMPTVGSLFGAALAVGPAPPFSLLVVGSPGWRQGRAEFDAALPDAGCALVYRRPAAAASSATPRLWMLEERLVASGEEAAAGTLALGASVALLSGGGAAGRRGADHSDNNNNRATYVLLGAPGLSSGDGRGGGGLSGVGVGGVVEYLSSVTAEATAAASSAADTTSSHAGSAATRSRWQRVKVLLFPDAGPCSQHGWSIAAVGRDALVVGAPLAPPSFPLSVASVAAFCFCPPLSAHNVRACHTHTTAPSPGHLACSLFRPRTHTYILYIHTHIH